MLLCGNYNEGHDNHFSLHAQASQPALIYVGVSFASDAVIGTAQGKAHSQIALGSRRNIFCTETFEEVGIKVCGQLLMTCELQAMSSDSCCSPEQSPS